jgi:hypothetical protein
VAERLGATPRETVLTVMGGNYPQTIPVEFIKDKVDALTGLRKGQEVTAHVNLRGNEYNGKYYVSLQAWKITGESVGIRSPEYGKREASQNGAPPPPTDHVGNDDGDEIPF